MRLRLVSVWVVGVCLSSSLGLPAQQAGAPDTPAASGPVSVVPHLVSFGGVLKDHTGKVATGVVNLTFSFYEFQEGGTPLWTETQSLQLDEQGRYTVLLGASAPTGLPLELFTTGQARWLGVQPGLSGVGELPRVLLAGVPYAVKAADADTLGGQPASAYVLAPTANTSSQASGTSAAVGTTVVVTQPASASAPGVTSNPSSAAPLATACTAVTSDGTAVANQIAKFTAPCIIGKSAISETSGNVGVGGTLRLPPTGTATTSVGFNSQRLDLQASSFKSGATAVTQHFVWQAEPVGNNLTNPSGKLNLLFASDPALPAETGLSINSKGIVTFASGQTLPKVTGNETVTGNVSAAQLISTVATGKAPLSVTSTTQVPNLNASLLGGLAPGAFALVGAPNNFTGNQSVTGSVSVSGNVGIGTSSPDRQLTVNGAADLWGDGVVG